MIRSMIFSMCFKHLINHVFFVMMTRKPTGTSWIRGCYHKIGISIEIFGFPRVPVPQFLIVIVDLLSPFCSLLLSSFYPFKISPVYFHDQFLAMISFLCVLALACFKPLTTSCLVLQSFNDDYFCL